MGIQIALGVAAGLGLGAMYALVAMGYTLLLASSGVFNLAQSAVVAIAALGMYQLYQVAKVPVFATLAILLAVGAVAGFISYALAVFPIERKGPAGGITEGAMLTTFGLAILVQSLLAEHYGSEPLPVRSYVTQSPIKIGNVPVRPIYLVMLGVAAFITMAAELLLRRTRVGLLLRASVEDGEGALAMGVPIRRIVFVTFALAGVLAAVAGALVAPVTFASPYIADNLALFGFAGMCIGGFGSFVGALTGGIVVGLIINLVPIWMNPNLAPILVYVALVLFLCVRPTGIFGRAGSFGSARLREI